MLFNSTEFAIFFPIVTLLYFWLPHRWRVIHLLAASCIFYMAFVPHYLLVLAATIVIDYAAGIWIEDTTDPRRKKWYLAISIVSTCLILFFFKYFNFFSESARAIAAALGIKYSSPLLEIVLPIGLSFHTFQSLSYVIEVYRGHQKAERDFWVYSLYVMFYPQLVAGPIERPQNLLHQFHAPKEFELGRVTCGLKMMAWGLFKKVVIADRISPLVDHVYSQPHGQEGLPFLIATVLFAVQIYCDFSGYSEMAIGMAQVMGFRLMTNFDRPYAAQSVAEFWRRWHISLSTWFKDYVFVPLGGSRGSLWQTAINLMITFLLSGLWHGAKWTFLVWGGLNGLLLVCELLFKRTASARPSNGTAIGWVSQLRVLRTFCLICLGWIFFRSANLEDGLYITMHLFDGASQVFTQNPAVWWDQIGEGTLLGFDLGVTANSLWLSVGLIGLLFLVERQMDPESIRAMWVEHPWWVRWPAYFGLVYGTLFLAVFQKSQFIYFQF